MAEYSENGRWGGQLTKRPLPEDPEIEALRPEERAHLAHVWHARAAMEQRVGDAFSVVHRALERLGSPKQITALAKRAIDDEQRHTELSRVVASRFAGKELPDPEPLTLEVPEHPGATPQLRDTLHVVGQCVLNETTASTFLETCLKNARGKLATNALRELLSDEVDHGRIGWAHLANIDQATRDQVARRMLPMAYLNLKTWREYSPVDAPHKDVFADHGSPSGAVTNEALLTALSELIIPGLQELKMNTVPLERWLDAGATTDTPPTQLMTGGPS